MHTFEDGTPEHRIIRIRDPCACHTAADTKDTLHYGEMLQASDRPKFVAAIQQEMAGLTDILDPCLRSELPPGVKALPAIWAFKRKRLPDWTISKWKARLNVHGGRQVHGVNFWDTYTPVVKWSTVRLVLTLSLLNGFKTRQVDFVQAFTQAPLDCPIFMEVPAGFCIVDGKLSFSGEANRNIDKDYVLRLTKNMYGLKQAGRNWYQGLHDELLTIGFKQSKVDKCLFICSGCIIVAYVDDCLLFSKDNSILDNVLNHLRTTFKITSEADVGAYLGLDIKRNSDGFLEITQPGLINKVITVCGLDNESNEHKTPADGILHASTAPNEPRQLSWNYSQVIRMLNYIATSSRPDILFAVHQCARFSTAPTRAHELVVKRIVRYLKGTRTKGYILKPTNNHCINCFVDADFPGAWTFNHSADPSSVRSRSGYVITYAHCPILWSSKLQSEIALSTTEAEYISLSQSLRDLIPMRTILHELSTVCNITSSEATTFSTVFEDSKGCVDLIAAPTMRPRSRHISIKYHHFREHVRSGQIRIKWISTTAQLADIFTKPLPLSKFISLRQTLLGW
jgi:hypothetical protein